jgi:uncharacterized membrane protein (DUF4010 family)
MMQELPQSFLQLAAALAIGLLIGIDRERHKGEGAQRAPFGLRTFALAALAGNIVMHIGDPLLVAAAALVIGAVVLLAYMRHRSDDPGLTSEVAFFVTFLLGALAQRNPSLAIAFGVIVTALLAFKLHLHRFARKILTEDELQDGVLFVAAALVVLPVLPNRAVDPYGVLNPFSIWRLVVVMLGISGFGYVALRALGPRLGLAVSGFASGFVSSTATIGAMGARAFKTPGVTGLAGTGAIVSNIATIIGLFVVLALTSPPLLALLTLPLALALAVVVVYAAIALWRTRDQALTGAIELDSPVDFKRALVFVLMITVISLTSAMLNAWLGASGVTLATSLAGFADAHTPTYSIGTLSANGGFSADQAQLPVLLVFTTNTVTKCVVVLSSGSRAFGRVVLPCLALMTGAMWIGFTISRSVA